MNDKKKLILNFLKKEGKKVSTTRIASQIKSNFWMADQYLKVLEKEGKIIKTQILHLTYWEVQTKCQIKTLQ